MSTELKNNDIPAISYLKKFRESIKETINCGLREMDIAHSGGIELPGVIMINAGDLYKIYQIIDQLCEVEDVVNESYPPCPVQSQKAIQICRIIAGSKSLDADEINFIEYEK